VGLLAVVRPEFGDWLADHVRDDAPDFRALGPAADGVVKGVLCIAMLFGHALDRFSGGCHDGAYDLSFVHHGD